MAQLNTYRPANRDFMGLINRRWRREFNKAVRLPSRDTIFDYFLSIANGECRFEPWTKHKIFKVVDFDSNNMKMNEVKADTIQNDLELENAAHLSRCGA